VLGSFAVYLFGRLVAAIRWAGAEGDHGVCYWFLDEDAMSRPPRPGRARTWPDFPASTGWSTLAA